MNHFCALILLLCTTANYTRAGDDDSGPIKYSLDLGQPFTTYVMTEKDKAWSRSLVRNLKYRGKAMHFVRTSLPLTVGESTVQGEVYQSLEKPDYFYVVPGDAVLILNQRWPLNPGVAGFSLHAPKSRNFLVALYCCSGVPFLSSSPVIKGKIDWKGHAWNRFRN